MVGVTLSEEQHKVANERARAAGLADRAEFLLKDYREVEGTFDRVVSVGMFEHVGAPQYREYFRTVREKLTPEGIALIHQEPLSFPDLSVAENIFLGRGTPRGAAGQIDWTAMRRRAVELLASLGLELDPRARMRGLSIADQQMVELAAALSQKARVLLMDEPTASLTPREVERLFGAAQ